MRFIASPFHCQLKIILFLPVLFRVLCGHCQMGVKGVGRVEIKEAKHKLIDFVGKGIELPLENKTYRKRTW